MNQINSTYKREVYMNYVKAFAIVAMVIGHTDSPINQYIYQYHMALFMFVSGYFYKDEYTQTPINLILRRLKSLYLPFVCYNLFFIIMCNVLNVAGVIERSYNIFNLQNFKTFVKSMLSFNAYVSYLGGFWFVKTLFIVTVCFCVLSFVLNVLKLRKEWIRALIILAIYAAEWVILYNDISLSKNIIQAPMALPIYYLGYLFHKYKSRIKLNFYCFILSIILIFINAHFGIVDMDSLTYTGPIFYIISSLAGICINIYISDLIYKKWGNVKYLNFIGQSTYIILAFHLLTKELMYNIINYFNMGDIWGIWIIDVLVAVNVSLLLNIVWQHIKKYVKNKFIKNRGN